MKRPQRGTFLTQRTLAIVCLVLTIASGVQSAPLPPGGSLYPVPLTAAPGGAVIAGGVPVPFASGLYSGTLTSTVLTGDPTNPLGGLTFTYLISNAGVSLDKIDRLTVSDFNPFLSDGGYSGPGLPPTLMDRSAVGTIGFSFLTAPIGPGELVPGTTSALLIVRTDATTYTPVFASVINGTTASVPSFAPTIVPEPAGLALLGIGVLGLLCRGRRDPRE